MNLMQSIHELPINEKLQIMEFLWNEISREELRFESPEWHKTALAETEVRLADGKEEVIEWDKAKKDLRKKFE